MKSYLCWKSRHGLFIILFTMFAILAWKPDSHAATAWSWNGTYSSWSWGSNLAPDSIVRQQLRGGTNIYQTNIEMGSGPGLGTFQTNHIYQKHYTTDGGGRYTLFSGTTMHRFEGDDWYTNSLPADETDVEYWRGGTHQGQQIIEVRATGQRLRFIYASDAIVKGFSWEPECPMGTDFEKYWFLGKTNQIEPPWTIMARGRVNFGQTNRVFFPIPATGLIRGLGLSTCRTCFGECWPENLRNHPEILEDQRRIQEQWERLQREGGGAGGSRDNAIYPLPFSTVDSIRNPSGGIRLAGIAITGTVKRVLRTEDVMGEWEEIALVVANEDAQWEYVDYNPPATAFYRVVD